MPGFDGNGPKGFGRGGCGRGFGCGMNRLGCNRNLNSLECNRGLGRPVSKKEEALYLQERLEGLKEYKKMIESEIESLEKEIE